MPTLSDIPLFRDAEPEILRRFAGREVWGTHEPGAMVVDFDDVSVDVFFILSGALRAVIRTIGGREIILGDLRGGDIFGEMAAIDDAPRSASISVLNRAVVARMSGKLFIELATQSPIVARRLMRVLTERVRAGNERLVEHSALTIRYRLYAELLREGRLRGGSSTELAISPPPVQQVLAGRIGARREAVSREIADLIRRGAVARTAGALVILKPDLLQAAVRRELEE
jgi:CRP-like cAMP-binding protein